MLDEDAPRPGDLVVAESDEQSRVTSENSPTRDDSETAEALDIEEATKDLQCKGNAVELGTSTHNESLAVDDTPQTIAKRYAAFPGMLPDLEEGASPRITYTYDQEDIGEATKARIDFRAGSGALIGVVIADNRNKNGWRLRDDARCSNTQYDPRDDENDSLHPNAASQR